MISVAALEPRYELEYDCLVGQLEHSLLYTSRKYRDFLLRVIANTRAHYLVAHEDGQMVGALPAIIQQNQRFGAVINSLPFYGSNGGVLVEPGDPRADQVRHQLLGAFDELAREQQAGSSTIVTSPLSDDHNFYDRYSGFTWRESRIGQITPLPQVTDGREVVQARLMALYHGKTRNSIRKALDSRIEVGHSADPQALARLAELHRGNMLSIGAAPKPGSVFEAIRAIFQYDRDYRVYTATVDGLVVSALLVFFFNRTAEYFTPAVQAEWRSSQALSLLVFEAMSDAVVRRCHVWNWGGTWLDQTGVYRFKSRWGTIDRPYHYYIRLHARGEVLRGLTRDQVLAEYPYFYVLPFAAG